MESKPEDKMMLDWMMTDGLTDSLKKRFNTGRSGDVGRLTLLKRQRRTRRRIKRSNDNAIGSVTGSVSDGQATFSRPSSRLLSLLFPAGISGSIGSDNLSEMTQHS